MNMGKEVEYYFHKPCKHLSRNIVFSDLEYFVLVKYFVCQIPVTDTYIFILITLPKVYHFTIKYWPIMW